MVDETEIPDVGNLTPEEFEQLQRTAEAMGLGFPKEEEKANIFTLFKKFFDSLDSTKIGNLDDKELYAIRTLKRASSFGNILGYKLVSEYLTFNSEILLSTSMSKGFAFVNAVQTQKRFLSTDSKSGEAKKKWSLFGKKEQSPEQQP